jgi:predicted  nucleic acid-binding Zn-ribbon protein
MDEKFDEMITIMKSISVELAEIKGELTSLNQKLDTIAIDSDEVCKEVSEINLKIDKLG